MGQKQYVVKLDQATDLYLTVYSVVWENCQWGSPSSAITWTTLEQAQNVATSVGHGTLGTTKP